MTSTSTPINRWRAFALLAVSFFMTIIDLTIVNVSLPTIGRDLHFTETSLQWVVTAYALTFGGFLLLGGRAADLFGRRRILMLGLAMFTAASLTASPDWLHGRFNTEDTKGPEKPNPSCRSCPLCRIRPSRGGMLTTLSSPASRSSRSGPTRTSR